MDNNITLLLKKDATLTNSENAFIAELNDALNFLSDDTLYSNFIDTLIDRNNYPFFKAKFNDYYAFTNSHFIIDFHEILQNCSNIKITHELLNSFSFDGNVSTYKLNKIYANNSMDFDTFLRFIKEQNITTIFTACEDNTINTITKDELKVFYDCELGLRDVYYDYFEKIMLPPINIANRILNKINNNTTIKQDYMCVYNGMNITTSIKNSNSLDTTTLLQLIYFMNVEEFLKACEQVEKTFADNLKIQQKEYEERKIDRLKKLEEQIKNDINFAKATQSKMRERYLKDILKDENNEVLSYLDMQRRSDGVIIFRSAEAQLFIHRIWEELNKK